MPEEPREREAHAREMVQAHPLSHLNPSHPAFPMTKLKCEYNLGVCSQGLSCLLYLSHGRVAVSPRQAFEGSGYFCSSVYSDQLLRIRPTARSEHEEACSSHYLHDCLRLFSLTSYIKLGSRAPELVPLDGEGAQNWNMNSQLNQRDLAVLHTLLAEFLRIPEDDLGATEQIGFFLNNSTLLL